MKQYYLGIEFGSTRVKAVLIDGVHRIVKSGDYTWKSSLENGVWTYHMEDVQDGLRTAIRNLGELPGAVSAMGISGMMHGYLAFDKDWNLLAPFRTWQNTMTGEAAEQLTARIEECEIGSRGFRLCAVQLRSTAGSKRSRASTASCQRQRLLQPVRSVI